MSKTKRSTSAFSHMSWSKNREKNRTQYVASKLVWVCLDDDDAHTYVLSLPSVTFINYFIIFYTAAQKHVSSDCISPPFKRCRPSLVVIHCLLSTPLLGSQKPNEIFRRFNFDLSLECEQALTKSSIYTLLDSLDSAERIREEYGWVWVFIVCLLFTPR